MNFNLDAFIDNNEEIIEFLILKRRPYAVRISVAHLDQLDDFFSKVLAKEMWFCLF